MEQIKELTKRLIANSFKELMLQTPFEKITIKMITDYANVIRPTFYNHFHDKYELVEWIVQDEIIEPTKELFKENKGSEGMKYLFKGFYEDKEYYKKAFDIVGQNGFGETLLENLAGLFDEVLKAYSETGQEPQHGDLLARYYAGGLITVISFVLFEADDMSLEEIIDTYRYMMEHSIYQLINDKKI